MRIPLFIALALAFFVSGLIGVAFAATPFDGAYHGTFTWVGNGNYRCNNGEMTIRVTDGKFNLGAPDSSERVSVSLEPDGSFSAQSGQRYVKGKIQGNQLTAVLTGQRCNYNWSLTK